MASKEPSGRGGGRGQRSSATNNYASTVATQSDVVKYRGKYKELKAKVKEIEMVSSRCFGSSVIVREERAGGLTQQVSHEAQESCRTLSRPPRWC